MSEVVDFLNGLGDRLHAVLLDFDRNRTGEDPVIHLYEGFLKAYDAKLRQTRGVYYTPKAVVSFIVRSVDDVLRNEFGLSDGLADTTTWGEFVAAHPQVKIPDGVSPGADLVRVLDPATGTGTFLVEIIDLIHTRLWNETWTGESESEKRRLWNAWVPRHLLPRLYGFELMMAPYAVAHMKIGLKLQETQYDFKGIEEGPDGRGRPARARVFLTNALEPPQDLDLQLAFMSEAMAHEAKAANLAKANARFTAVLGNPPYSKLSGNLGPAAVALISPFRYVDGIKVKERGALALEMALQDDYLKFIGLGSSRLRESGIGCLGFITNSRYLSAPSLRGVRASMTSWFNMLLITNAGGQVSERTAEDVDENLFDIEQGVAVLVAAMRSGERAFSYSRLKGTRAQKSSALDSADLRWTPLSPKQPMYPLSVERETQESVYDAWPSLDELMTFNSGAVITSRDSLLISFDPDEAVRKIQHFASCDLSEEKAAERQGFSIKDKWDVASAQTGVRHDVDEGLAANRVERILYRPYDLRYIYYDHRLIDTPSRPVHSALHATKNVAILTPKVKNTSDFTHIFVSEEVAEKKSASHDRATQMFPLYKGIHVEGEPELNFRAPAGWADDQGDTSRANLFYYCYAILHSPVYRATFGRSLMDHYPRIPPPGNMKLLSDLVLLGNRLVTLHLLDADLAPDLKNPHVRFIGRTEDAVLDRRKVADRRDAAGRVYVNAHCWFETVGIASWEHVIGGYQPAQKWLKDRGATTKKAGHVLAASDLLHYRRMIVAMEETAKTMTEIDGVIDDHGGWPDAFRGVVDAAITRGAV